MPSLSLLSSLDKFSFKNVIFGHRVQKVPENSAKTSLPLVAFQNRPCVSPWRKQGWIPRRTISWEKAPLPPQKENWAFFWTFNFHFLAFNGVFLTLRCRTLVLKPLHGYRTAALLLNNGYPLLRFPNMVNNNYSPKWRWLVFTEAAKWRGKHPLLATDTEVNNCFSIY